MSERNLAWRYRRKTVMKMVNVIFVKIYITESSKMLNTIVSYLKNDAKIRGISVFRAISGFGDKRDHIASLVDLSLDLPLSIEFFDSKEKVEPALEYLSSIIKHKHIVFWDAKA